MDFLGVAPNIKATSMCLGLTQDLNLLNTQLDTRKEIVIRDASLISIFYSKLMMRHVIDKIEMQSQFSYGGFIIGIDGWTSEQESFMSADEATHDHAFAFLEHCSSTFNLLEAEAAAKDYILMEDHERDLSSNNNVTDSKALEKARRAQELISLQVEAQRKFYEMKFNEQNKKDSFKTESVHAVPASSALTDIDSYSTLSDEDASTLDSDNNVVSIEIDKYQNDKYVGLHAVLNDVADNDLHQVATDPFCYHVSTKETIRGTISSDLYNLNSAELSLPRVQSNNYTGDGFVSLSSEMSVSSKTSRTEPISNIATSDLVLSHSASMHGKDSFCNTISNVVKVSHRLHDMANAKKQPKKNTRVCSLPLTSSLIGENTSVAIGQKISKECIKQILNKQCQNQNERLRSKLNYLANSESKEEVSLLSGGIDNSAAHVIVDAAAGIHKYNSKALSQEFAVNDHIDCKTLSKTPALKNIDNDSCETVKALSLDGHDFCESKHITIQSKDSGACIYQINSGFPYVDAARAGFVSPAIAYTENKAHVEEEPEYNMDGYSAFKSNSLTGVSAESAVIVHDKSLIEYALAQTNASSTKKRHILSCLNRMTKLDDSLNPAQKAAQSMLQRALLEESDGNSMLIDQLECEQVAKIRRARIQIDTETDLILNVNPLNPMADFFEEYKFRLIKNAEKNDALMNVNDIANIPQIDFNRIKGSIVSYIKSYFRDSYTTAKTKDKSLARSKTADKQNVALVKTQQLDAKANINAN